MIQEPLLYNRNEYQAVKQKLNGDCPFDPGRLGVEERFILNDSEHWLWLINPFPYWKYHTMFVPKRHITLVEELSPQEFAGFQSQLSYARDRYDRAGIKDSDGNVMNNYNYSWITRINHEVAKTLAHLHVHMYPGNENMWTPILDPLAYQTDIGVLK